MRRKPKLYRLADTLADDQPQYSGSERARVRLAAECVHDAAKALEKGDLGMFFAQVLNAQSFIEPVPFPTRKY